MDAESEAVPKKRKLEDRIQELQEDKDAYRAKLRELRAQLEQAHAATREAEQALRQAQKSRKVQQQLQVVWASSCCLATSCLCICLVVY